MSDEELGFRVMALLAVAFCAVIWGIVYSVRHWGQTATSPKHALWAIPLPVAMAALAWWLLELPPESGLIVLGVASLGSLGGYLIYRASQLNR